MTSIAPTPDVSPPCSNPHVDGCPDCYYNVEPPQILLRGADGCDASYRCSDCGRTWDTAWGAC